MAGWTSYIPLLLAIAASLSLLWTNRWRYNIAAMAALYLAVFWFVSQVWPIGLASIKLIAGWMAAAMLGASVTASERPEAAPPVLSSRIFRLVAGVFILILAISAAPQAAEWIPAPLPAITASLLIMGMGLLQLSTTFDPLRVIIGLLTILSGFEIIYAAVVSSVLVTGLLALVTLGLALAGAYWLSLTTSEEPV